MRVKNTHINKIFLKKVVSVLNINNKYGAICGGKQGHHD
jgi:hypothetical protein